MLKDSLNTFWKLQNKFNGFCFGPSFKLSTRQTDLIKKLGIDPCSFNNRSEAINAINDAILEKKVKQGPNRIPVLQQPIPQQYPTPPQAISKGPEPATDAQRSVLLKLGVPITKNLGKTTASTLISLAKDRDTAKAELAAMRNLVGKAVGDHLNHTKGGDQCRER
jgi:hypothetical protein